MATYALSTTVESDFADALGAVKAAFASQGFGVLSEIDVRSVMLEKLGTTIEPYVILGVCNPQLALTALQLTRHVGLLLPCTVVVRQGDGHVEVEALNPDVIASIDDTEGLEAVATEAAGRVRAALGAVRDQPV